MRVPFFLLCLAACTSSDVDVPDAACAVRAGVYDTVEEFAGAAGDCPAWVVEMFGRFGTVTVQADRPCGSFRPGGAFAVDCVSSGCGGDVEVDAVADETGLRDGTIALRSSCGDEECHAIDPPCEHVIPVHFVYVSEPPPLLRSAAQAR